MGLKLSDEDRRELLAKARVKPGVFVLPKNARVAAEPKPGTVTLPYPPSTNHLYASVRGRKVLSREGRAYKQHAAAVAINAGLRPMDGPVVVSLSVYRPRRAGDLDNTLKALLDSLKGVAWHDDSQVVGIRADRYDDKANPRVEVAVEAKT